MSKGQKQMSWHERHLWWLLLATLVTACVVKIGLS